MMRSRPNPSSPNQRFPSSSAPKSSDLDVIVRQAAILTAFLLLAMPALANPLERAFAMFPDARLAPPIPVADGSGALFIPGWGLQDGPDALYLPDNGETAGFLQIIRPNDNYNIDSFFDELIRAAGLSSISRPQGVEAEAFKAVFGPMVAAVFGQARKDGVPVSFFADLHGPDERGIIGTLIYAPPATFDSWDGVLLPLVRNGYVQDPAIFENRSVMRAGSDTEKTRFYVGMVNTKIMSEFGALQTLSAGALQAAQNASTIASCAGANNCSVSYDGMGNAVADFDLE